MQKTLQFILILILVPLAAKTQDKIAADVKIVAPVVTTPYAYFDLFRVKTDGWIVQEYRNNAWQDYSIDISTKNTDSRFLQLKRYKYYVFTAEWDTIFDVEQVFVKDNNNRITEVSKTSRVSNGYKETKVAFTYTGPKLEKTTATERNTTSSVYTPLYEEFYLYDTTGKRIRDSLITVGSAGKQNTNYEYDINNRCIKSSVIDRFGDTVLYNLYEYNTLGLLTKNTIYLNFGTMTQFEIRDYSYNSNGQLTSHQLAMYSPILQKVTPTALYLQNFDIQGQLTQMVYKTYVSNAFSNRDSIVLKPLPNGNYDTSYSYLNLTENTWEQTPAYRYIFNKSSSTGVAKTIAPDFVINAYPNPVTNTLTIDFELVTGGSFVFTLTDITGKIVKTITACNFEPGNKNIAVNMADITPGIYFVNCGSNTVKIVKN
ncbi:MAG TPA: T9SS type A sorting domain-containing protein [Bacteroidia bacterium]|nr:T9SS type A sorting domain-containing protein [Bacteroidia bacterium]